jgi:hypothetical protein
MFISQTFKSFNMKMKIAKATVGILMLLMVVSCQDALEEKYSNPEQTGQASIGKFFTRMLNNDRVRPSYWNVRTFLMPQSAVYTQTVSFTNSNRRYQQQLSYIDDYWRDYYTPTGSGIVAHLREIEKTYASLTEADKARNEVFIYAARVVYADQTAQMVDLWGDVPFSQAGMLNLQGESFPPKFDDAVEVYSQLSDILEETSSYFKTVTLESTTGATFSKQDILLKGNLDKWERYSNSIRLRLLMRISFQDENKAETDAMEMLNDPANYPLVDDAAFDILLDPLTTYNDNMRNALTELSSHVAPEFLLDQVLKPVSDPRIRVWYDKGVSQGTPNADYFSMPADISASEQETNISQGKYAVLDSATFLFNKAFPGIVITSAEVNFLKAEAQERWGSTAEAKIAYEKGVSEAVKFLFKLNTLGGGTEDALQQSELDDLLASPSVAYTGTTDELLAKIWTQKWLDFGFMQSVQGWAELRRTNTPALDFLPDNSTPEASLPPTRLLYPSSEKTYNALNYADVAAEDKVDVKLFWDIN